MYFLMYFCMRPSGLTSVVMRATVAMSYPAWTKLGKYSVKPMLPSQALKTSLSCGEKSPEKNAEWWRWIENVLGSKTQRQNANLKEKRWPIVFLIFEEKTFDIQSCRPETWRPRPGPVHSLPRRCHWAIDWSCCLNNWTRRRRRRKIASAGRRWWWECTSIRHNPIVLDSSCCPLPRLRHHSGNGASRRSCSQRHRDHDQERKVLLDEGVFAINVSLRRNMEGGGWCWWTVGAGDAAKSLPVKKIFFEKIIPRVNIFLSTSWVSGK